MGTRLSGSTGTGDPKNPGDFFRFNRRITGWFRLKSSGFSRFNRKICGRCPVESGNRVPIPAYYFKLKIKRVNDYTIVEFIRYPLGIPHSISADYCAAHGAVLPAPESEEENKLLNSFGTTWLNVTISEDSVERFTVDDGWQLTKGWDQAVEFCTSKNMQLCDIRKLSENLLFFINIKSHYLTNKSVIYAQMDLPLRHFGGVNREINGLRSKVRSMV